ncbi:MAG: rRNA maturation RNase YbeY [Hyphomicrobiaceae bacterium]|nr:rRNA maturation RNase YbeY [Hyphomicrobiaceae bacterium]
MSPDRPRGEPAQAAAEAGVAEDPEPPSRRDSPAGLVLDVLEEAGDWSRVPGREAEIRAAAAALCRHPEAKAGAGRAATIVLTDDASVRKLNGAYRGKDQATNVLSFPFEAPPGTGDETARDYLGDVVLAAETVLREADEMGVPPGHHLQHLVIHGLLHLLGFDHVEDGEAEAMEAIETEVLKGIGIADPYAA